jgi:beta-N-acetylhexosaminidase
MRAIAALLATLSLIAGAGVPPASGHELLSSRTWRRARAVTGAQIAALKPPIVWKGIPYGAKRKREMGAYSERHYGTWTWHLTGPKVIVEHYTASTTFSSAWNTFAANSKNLGELPGVCAHFVVDTDGTIYQLVPLWIRCRHAVGMNYTSIGIEHVGTSDEMVLNDRAQMRSSLRLTLWLMAKFGINIGNVIGHAETLQSPYHHELYPSWRCYVHADFPHRAMKRYRTRERDLAAKRSVPVGKGPVWVDSGC